MHERPVTVTAQFDRLDGSEPFDREVVLDVHLDYVYMHGGPTGYESLPAGAFKNPAIVTRGWCACAGTRGVWLRCSVSGSEMARAGQELGLLVR